MCSIGQFESLWRTLTYGSASQIEKLFAQKDIINALQEGFRPVEEFLNNSFIFSNLLKFENFFRLKNFFRFENFFRLENFFGLGNFLG